MDDPTNPADRRPSEVESQLADGPDGDGQFQPTAEGSIRCLTCGRESPAADHRADDARRLEGASDPDDMLIIVPIACPACGSTGSLTLGYGPLASEADAAVLQELERDPHGSSRVSCT